MTILGFLLKQIKRIKWIFIISSSFLFTSFNPGSVGSSVDSAGYRWADYRFEQGFAI